MSWYSATCQVRSEHGKVWNEALCVEHAFLVSVVHFFMCTFPFHAPRFSFLLFCLSLHHSKGSYKLLWFSREKYFICANFLLYILIMVILKLIHFCCYITGSEQCVGFKYHPSVLPVDEWFFGKPAFKNHRLLLFGSSLESLEHKQLLFSTISTYKDSLMGL